MAQLADQSSGSPALVAMLAEHADFKKIITARISPSVNFVGASYSTPSISSRAGSAGGFGSVTVVLLD